MPATWKQRLPISRGSVLPVPDSDIRATAEYDAAAALIVMEDWGRATSSLEDFRARYPDSEFTDDISQKLAVSYLESGRGAAAAGEFIRIANAESSTDDVRREALWKAAELYKDDGQIGPEQQTLRRDYRALSGSIV